MYTGFSQRSLNYVRARATLHMRHVVQIDRDVGGTYDEENLTVSSGTRSTVYEGPARIWEVTGGGAVVVGDDSLNMQNTMLSIPWDTAPAPRKDDVGIIIASYSDDTMAGRAFEILSASQSGDLRATRRYNIQLVEAKGTHDV